MVILSSCSVSTAVWLHNLNFNEMPEKTQDGNAASCFKQTLEAALYHVINHPSRISKTCWSLLGKKEQIHK